jgi:tRNA 2-thiocytidine biosynthesis protein TtcA
MGSKWRNEAERRASLLSKRVDKAVREHGMIEEGDRILVGVSGGKDSLCLLRLLEYRLAQSPAKYELVAGHVRGDARGAGIEVPSELVRWVEQEGVPFHVRDPAVTVNEPLPMDCERCSRCRRKTLFEMARDLDCNKIALGHNLEDFAHTALMNLLAFGKLETMAFARVYFGGLFTVIRPLAYVRENEIVRLVTAGELPVVESGCPLASTSRRAAVRRLMRSAAAEFRHPAMNIVRAASRNAPETEEEDT